MPIAEKHIAEVVAEASARMQEPEYISTQVDTFMGAQPRVSQYVMSHSNELTVEGVVSVLFHAALLHQSVARARGRVPSLISLADLDAAAQQSLDAEALAKTEPELASYIVSNIELGHGKETDRLAQKVLAQVAQSLVNAC
jgi:hypothetical protein